MLRGQIKPSFRERKKVNDTFDNQIVKVVANKEESDEIWQKSKKEKPKTCMKVKVRVKVMRGSRRGQIKQIGNMIKIKQGKR